MRTSGRKLDQLLERAGQGDRQALDDLFSGHTPRLERMVALRLDRRLRRRVDVDDVLQSAYLEAARRLPAYIEGPPLPRPPFFLWLRSITLQSIVGLHRFHLSAKARDVRREVVLEEADRSESRLAPRGRCGSGLVGIFPCPGEAFLRAEVASCFRECLRRLGPLDREVIVLQHFDRLTVAEMARALDMEEETVRKRNLRAMRRLRKILLRMPGGRDGLWEA